AKGGPRGGCRATVLSGSPRWTACRRFQGSGAVRKMTSKSWVVALMASAGFWSCSPVANPIVAVSSGTHVDAAGGAAGADGDGSVLDVRPISDAVIELSQYCG